MPPTDEHAIEPMRRTDAPAVRRICVATCWMGDYRPEVLADEQIWADYWTRWFTDRQRQHSWVVRRSCDGQVVGYLTGTPDERRFHRYVPWLLPRFAWRLLAPKAKRGLADSAAKRPPGCSAQNLPDPLLRRMALRNAIRSVIRAETGIPARLMAAYPATWHVDLLPEARGRGLGAALLDLFIARMRQLGVPGLHAQPMSINTAIIALLDRKGFTLACTRRLTAFEHAVKDPIDVQTWVKQL